tara:strand:+ start:439 stop:846 length:408 start_codon:yes stop_codon:yes gene_type:complete
MRNVYRRLLLTIFLIFSFCGGMSAEEEMCLEHLEELQFLENLEFQYINNALTQLRGLGPYTEILKDEAYHLSALSLSCINKRGIDEDYTLTDVVFEEKVETWKGKVNFIKGYWAKECAVNDCAGAFPRGIDIYDY